VGKVSSRRGELGAAEASPGRNGFVFLILFITLDSGPKMALEPEAE